ncbi:MAG: arsenate reductase family protein, partial [Bacteroidota bacterium]
MKIYHNPRCRKSRETLGIINEKGASVEIVEYLSTPPTKEELSEIISMLGIKPIELIRKGEEIFKTNFKGNDLTDDQWIDAMLEYPKLIERPIV